MTTRTLSEATKIMPSGLNRWDDSTLMCAVVHYALSVADPSGCVVIMERFWPRLDGKSWTRFIAAARASQRQRDIADSALREADLA